MPFPALALDVNTSSTNRRTAQWRRCIPALSAASSRPLTSRSGFHSFLTFFPSNQGSEGWRKCVIALTAPNAEPVGAKPTTGQDPVCDGKLLSSVPGPGAHDAEKVAVTSACRRRPAPSADRPDVVSQQAAPSVDQVAETGVLPRPRGETENVELGVALRLRRVHRTVRPRRPSRSEWVRCQGGERYVQQDRRPPLHDRVDRHVDDRLEQAQYGSDVILARCRVPSRRVGRTSCFACRRRSWS